MSEKPVIGCLALQGAVEPHRAHIEAAGAEFHAVKTPAQFAGIDAFILPGGESTTMLKLIERFELWNVLAEELANKPVWGICAGCILSAKDVHYSSQRIEDQNGKTQKSFGLLPITVERNGYGRQVDSHHAIINDYEVSLIRAPIIRDAGNCEIIASHEGDPVWVKKGNKMATTFHPELTLDFPSPMHQAFVDLVKANA
ncbi:MAG: pyridoxal 5'-phosphate synthase glutaminase subunit PdxT [Pseudomonadota bacterium]